MIVTLIAAVASNGVIGRNGSLPWHLPADLRRFKQRTSDHHLIIGRTTWESIGRPLPRRTFVVVTRTPGEERPGVLFVPSLDRALERASAAGESEAFVAGGSSIYREALERDLVDRLDLTRIERAYEGDTRFPELDASRFELVAREVHAADPERDLPAFAFERSVRRR